MSAELAENHEGAKMCAVRGAARLTADDCDARAALLRSSAMFVG